MFSIRSSRGDDCDQIYEQTRKLFLEHRNLGHDIHLTPEALRDLHRDCFVQFRVLTVNSDNDEEVIGNVVFTEDVDFNFGGCGIYVDQIYICEGYRGKGLGRRLMEAVKAEARRVSANYVKLYFQKNGIREAIYTHLGFHNASTSSPFIKFFEIAGREEMMARFNLDANERVEANVRTIPLKPGIEATKYQDAQDSADGCGQLALSFSLGSHNAGDKHPTAQLIVVIKHSALHQSLSHILENLATQGICINDAPLKLWSQISTWNVKAGITNPGLFTCAFIEEPSVNCWFGRTLTFCNFVGDVRVITRNLLVHQVKACSSKWGPVLRVRFEVEHKECENTDNTKHLIALLNSLGIHEETLRKCMVMTKEEIVRDADE
uniref:N-acetyltransferase domain-containing protein n=1 Tax=Mesocestoides corti TaxID=53468 RepID=A0A5K3F724_MESCO